MRHLERPEHYALALAGLLDELETQQVRYVEITLSAGVILWRRQPLDEVWDALRAASQRPGIVVRWIPDAVRQFGPDAAAPVLDFAIRHRREGIVAFGIGGDEERGPARDFAALYAQARTQGLRLVAHAGEVAGPDSIWAALEIGAERIGHGIRAIDDPVLVRHLADRQVPLEICPTSNLRTGAVASLDRHPLRRLWDAGVPLVLNSDDPAIFGTTLTAEYELARRQFGFTDEELERLRANAFRYAFDWNPS